MGLCCERPCKNKEIKHTTYGVRIMCHRCALQDNQTADVEWYSNLQLAQGSGATAAAESVRTVLWWAVCCCGSMPQKMRAFQTGMCICNDTATAATSSATCCYAHLRVALILTLVPAACAALTWVATCAATSSVLLGENTRSLLHDRSIMAAE